MAHRQLSSFIRSLYSKLGDQNAGVLDAQLLERFVAQRDQAAFELLLWRHERMVQSVCRRLLRREQDVEDAFQATFLVLACKAGSIGKREALASWLYKIAYRVALREKSRMTRRIRYERQSNGMALEAVSSSERELEADRQDVRQVLDEEVHQLPEKYRAPIVLCYLEGRTNAQAAQELQCPVGTVVTRLARARKRLRARLTRRGLGVSTGLLVTALSQTAITTTVRAALREATVRAAPLFAADHAAAGLISAQVAALTRGAMTAMTMTKMKLAAALVLATCLLGTGTGLLTFRTLAAETTMNLTADPPASAARQTNEPQEADQAGIEESDERAPESQKAGKSRKRDQKGDKQISAKEVLTKSFKTGKAPRLVVELQNGAVEITADADGSIDARVTKEARAETQEAAQEALKGLEVKMEQEGDTVRITTHEPAKEKRRIHASASAALRVPPGTTLDVQTANGAVSLTGATGRTRIETANGAIRVKDCKSTQDLKTANGAIHVDGGAGQLKLTTANGSVHIQGTKAVVTAHSTNGALHFQGTLGEGQQSFHTNNGSIVLSLPADARFRVEADTTHGRVSSEFSITSSGGKSKTRLNGTVGENPSTTLKLHTQNGSITLKRQKAAE